MCRRSLRRKERHMSIADRLTQLGITIPQVAPPAGSYVPALRSGHWVYTAGQIPFVDGALPATGKVGAQVTAEDAEGYARICAINALAAVATVVELDQVVRVVKVTG